MTEKSIIIESLLQDKKNHKYSREKYETVHIISKVLYEQEVKLMQVAFLACHALEWDKVFVVLGRGLHIAITLVLNKTYKIEMPAVLDRER
jgi:hypothetical protein